MEFITLIGLKRIPPFKALELELIKLSKLDGRNHVLFLLILEIERDGGILRLDMICICVCMHKACLEMMNCKKTTTKLDMICYIFKKCLSCIYSHN